MTGQQIEKGLKLCSAGAKEKITKCPQCPYMEKGCLSALLADAIRYIDYLKSPRRSYEKGKKAKNRNPEYGEIPVAKSTESPKAGKPAPVRNGKPVREWLEEERLERERRGEKDELEDVLWQCAAIQKLPWEGE